MSGDQRFFYGFAQAWRGQAAAAVAAASRSSPTRTRPRNSASTGRCATTRPSTRPSASSRATRCTCRRKSASRSGEAERRLRRGGRLKRAGLARRQSSGRPRRRCMTSVDSIHSRAALERRFGPSLPLAGAGDGDDRHGRLDHGLDHRQRRRARHEPRLRASARSARSGSRPASWAAMTLSMLTTPWLLAPLRLPPHLHRRGRAAAWSAAWSAASARSFELILAMRVAEGLAAGVLQPIPAIIILHAFGERRARQGDGHLRLRRRPRAGGRPERRRRAGRVVGLALDLLRGRAVLPGRDGDGAPLPADQRARRRADRSARRPARCPRPRPDRGRGAGAAQRHGPPQRRDAAVRPGAARPERGRRDRLHRPSAPRRPAADGARPVRATGRSRWAAWSPSSTAWRCSARPTWCRCSCRRRCTCRRRRPARCCCRPASPWR